MTTLPHLRLYRLGTGLALIVAPLLFLVDNVMHPEELTRGNELEQVGLIWGVAGREGSAAVLQELQESGWSYVYYLTPLGFIVGMLMLMLMLAVASARQRGSGVGRRAAGARRADGRHRDGDHLERLLHRGCGGPIPGRRLVCRVDPANERRAVRSGQRVVAQPVLDRAAADLHVTAVARARQDA